MPDYRTSLLTVIAVIATTGAAGAAQTLTVDEFRRELVGLPLCGTPPAGPLAGKALCTVHLPDGTAILAGSGILVRGIWDVQDGHICRRNAHDAPERRRCVDYMREDQDHFRNSDNVEFCIGPCPPPSSTAPASPVASNAAQSDGSPRPEPPLSADAPPRSNSAAPASQGAGTIHQESAPGEHGVNAQGR